MTWKRLATNGRVRAAAIAGACLALAWGGFEGLTRTAWFGERVRSALALQLEALTGGEVAINAFRFGETRLAFEVSGVELRSRDAADLPPVLTVEAALLRIRPLALLTGGASLAALSVQRPVARIVVRADGTSNLPTLGGAEELAELDIQRLEVNDGVVVWNGEPYAARFSGSDLRVRTSRDRASGEHEVDLSVANVAWDAGGRRAPAGASISLRAALQPGEIRIASAAMRGDGYLVRASGALRNLQAPRLQADYAAEADYAALAPWLGEWFGTDGPGFAIAGTLATEGELEWAASSGRTRYAGRLRGAGLSAAFPPTDASFEARYAGDRNRVSVSEFTGRVFGGTLAGAADVDGLASSLRLSARAKAAGVELGRVATSFGIGSLPWSGALAADLTAAASGASGLEIDADLTVRPTGGPAQLPVEGHGALSYRSRTGVVAVSALELATPNARIALNGAVDRSRSADLAVQARLQSKQAGARILAALQSGIALPPSAPDGVLSFAGALRGRLGDASSASLEGDFALADFAFGGQRWERLAFQGSLAADRLAVQSGWLADQDGRIEFRGELPLRPGVPLNATVAGQNLDAGKLAAASGLGIPIAGSASLDLELSGSLEEPTAEARLEIADPAFFGESFDRLAAEARYGPARFELRNLVLARGASRLRGQAALAAASQALEFDLESNRWLLDEFDWIRLLAPSLGGSARFELRGRGQLGRGPGFLRGFDLEGAWEAAELRRDAVELGRWTGEFRTDRAARQIEIEWRADLLEGVAEGRAALPQDGPAGYEGGFAFRDVSFGRIAALLDLPLEKVEGAVEGQGNFAGVLGEPESFQAQGTIDRLEAALPLADGAAYLLANVFPLRWDIRDGALRLDAMHLQGPGTDFEIDGSLGLLEERALDLSLDGNLNLLLLSGFAPGIEASGRADVGLRIQGALGAPVVAGTVEVVEGALRGSGIPLALNEMRGLIVLQGGQGRIETLTAMSGGGTIRFGGAMTYSDEGFGYRLRGDARNVRLNHPESVTSVIDGQLTLAGVGSRSILSGDALISRMSIDDNMTFAQLLADLRQPEGVGAASSLFESMQLNVHLGSVRHLPIETSLVRDVEADFDLDLAGTVAEPAALGTIGIAQGEIRVLGTRYRVNRGDIRFPRQAGAEPVLNVELETRIRDVDIALVLSGPARALDLSYRSDPPLPFHELVNLVAVGKEPATDPSLASRRRLEQQSLVQTGADSMLSQAISRPISQRMQRFFGVSRLKVDPQIGGLEANPSARISTEQQLASDLTLIYSYDLSSAQQQAVRIEWNPDRRWSFIVTRDQNGLVGSDILYKLRLP